MAQIDKHFSREVVALPADAQCSQAARLMKERRIGSVAVRERGRIVGLVTERDLCARLLSDGGFPATPIGEVMRRDQPRIDPQASEMECARLMQKHFTRHLLVARDDEIVGVISMKDVIQLMLDEKQWLIVQLQTYITHG